MIATVPTPKWKIQVKKKTAPLPLLRSLPLALLCPNNTGKNPPKKAGCGSCSTYQCTLKGEVKIAHCMQECQDWRLPAPANTPTRPQSDTIRLDHHNLHPGEIPGIRFNASIIESGDGYLYCFRNGWSGSRLYVCRLTKDFQPIPKAWAKLELSAKGIRGHEDPRLFRLNGKLHCSFIAYGGNRTSVKFCRINEETLRVEDEFFPQIPGRKPWEKNHSYFDYQGIAHAVYETAGKHRILRVEGHSASFAYETPFNGHYGGGPMRGGASPILVDGEFWHFFHGVTTQANRRRRYNMGVTVFRAEPPFDILRYTPHPIDEADTDRQHDAYCDCLFPCGVVWDGTRFIVAAGDHDRWSTIRFYDRDAIESQLISP